MRRRLRSNSSGDEVAGVSFEDEPEFAARMEIEGASGAESDVGFKEGAGIDFADHCDAALLGGFERAMKDVACAEPDRTFERKKDIAGADGNTNLVFESCVTKRHFDRCS